VLDSANAAEVSVSRRALRLKGTKAVPNGEATEDPADLAEWADTVIHERLLDSYRSSFREEATVELFAYLHGQAWRALFAGDKKKFSALRCKLMDLLAKRDLGRKTLARVDADVVRELLETVMTRYEHSMSAAVSNHLALIQLGGQLKAAQHAEEREAARVSSPLK
jgi:hypothetical protein